MSNTSSPKRANHPSVPAARVADDRRRSSHRRQGSTSTVSRAVTTESTSETVVDVVTQETRAWLDTIVMGLNLCPFARAALPGTKIFVSQVTSLEALRFEISAELAILKNAPTDVASTTLIVLAPVTVAALNATTFEGFMEGAKVVADEEAAIVTFSLPETIRDELVGDWIEIVPFHPSATFHDTEVSVEDEIASGGYTCTYLDVDGDDGEYGEDVETETNNNKPPPNEAALREMIAKHAALQGGADTRADWQDVNLKRNDEKNGENEEASEGDDFSDDDGNYSDNKTDSVDPADYTGRSPHPVLHLLRQSDVDAADEMWYSSSGPGDDIRSKNAALLRGMGEDALRKMLSKCCRR